MTKNCLSITKLNSPLGQMFAIAVEEGLCLLEFADSSKLQKEFNQLEKHLKSSIQSGNNRHLTELNNQLEEYFKGSRQEFSIPLITPGTNFQNKVWKELQNIPYGQTRSYKKQAITLGDKNAVRAVAGANGSNRISILIPCQRVIGNNGQLIGYGGGLWRKKWLIEHEGSLPTQLKINAIVD